MFGVIRAEMLAEIESITLYNDLRRMGVFGRRKPRGEGKLQLTVFRWRDNGRMLSFR